MMNLKQRLYISYASFPLSAFLEQPSRAMFTMGYIVLSGPPYVRKYFLKLMFFSTINKICMIEILTLLGILFDITIFMICLMIASSEKQE